MNKYSKISIGKPLLRVLSQILAKYDRHDDIYFAENNGTDLLTGVTFDDDVESKDLSSFVHTLKSSLCMTLAEYILIS